MRKSYWFVGIAVAYFCVLPARAAVVEAEGEAKIEFKTRTAQTRELAIQNAKDHALMQAGSEATISNEANPNEIAPGPWETSRMPTIEKMKILREWQTDDSLHVRIAVVLEQSGDTTIVDQKYRKKVVLTPFHLQKSYHVEDISGISDGFPKELSYRLEAHGKFLTRRSPYQITSESNGPSQDRNNVKQIAGSSDAQFVVSGEIIDAGESEEGGYLGFFQHRRRRFEVEVVVYDGLSGLEITRHEIQEFADGDVTIDKNTPIASMSFFSTTYGQAISKAIDTATELIAWDLEDIPLTARVIRTIDGKIYIDAGSTSSFAAGDKMLAYKLDALWLDELGTNKSYGAAEAPLGKIAILQVEPMYSICKFQEGYNNLKVRVGDLVRVIVAGQKKLDGLENQ